MKARRTIDRLARRFGASAWRLAYAFLGRAADAEDAVQAAFLDVARRPERVPADAPWPWLAAVVRNKARELRRREGRRERRESTPAASPAAPADPVEAAVAAELAARVRSAIDELSEAERDALLLTTVSGLTHAEAGRALGAPASTISTRVARALDRVRRRVGASSAAIVPFVTGLPAPAPMGGLGAASARWASNAASAAPASSGTAVVGGIVVTKKIAVAAVLLLLALGVGAIRGGWFDSAEPIDETHDRSPARESADAAPADPAPAGVEPKTEKPKEPDPGRPAPATTDSRRLAVELLPRPEPRVPWSEQWARRSGGSGGGTAVSPGGSKFGPGSGGIRVPRWASPPPPKGTSVVSGRVVDGAGSPIAGAKVYRMSNDAKPSASDENVFSFEFLKEIATTDESGRYVAKELVAGEFRVVANWRRLLNRPRGMDCANARPVTVADHATESGVDLTVDVVRADLGRLIVTIVDEDGNPAQRVWTFGGYQEGFTDENGRASFAGLPPGRVTVYARQTGYEPVDRVVELARGATAQVRIQLELAQSGGMTLGGRVVDDEGAPVAGAQVYVTAGNGTLRKGTTDADGRYRFDDLPSDLPDDGVGITVWGKGFRGANRQKIQLPRTDVDFELVRPLTVVVRVLDETTGEPIRQYNVEAVREEVVDGKVEDKYATRALVWDENGEQEFQTVAGRHRIWMEAPDREPIEVAVDVPAGTGKWIAEVRWP